MDRDSYKPIIAEPELIDEELLIEASGGGNYTFRGSELICNKCKKTIISSSLDVATIMKAYLRHNQICR